jgi:hypothetical protein
MRARRGEDMVDDVGPFRTAIDVAPLASPDHWIELTGVLVDADSEYNWLPASLLHDLGVAPVRVDRFETDDGRVLDRDVGFAMIYAGGRATPSVVVFADDTDTVRLGAIALDGLNLRVDTAGKKLVSAGPVPAALGTARSRSQRMPNAFMADSETSQLPSPDTQI